MLSLGGGNSDKIRFMNFIYTKDLRKLHENYERKNKTKQT